MHRTHLPWREIPAALVEIRRDQRAAAERERRGGERRSLARQYHNRARDQPQTDRAHRSVTEDEDAASRITWIEALSEAPLVQAVTTPSAVTAIVG